MFDWFKAKQKPNIDFLRLFDEWFDEKYTRSDWKPEDIKQLRYFCELWWLKGRQTEMRSRW